MESESCELPKMDPESELLKSKEETNGVEWETYKENVRPLKRGRNIKLLNDALKSHSQLQLKTSVLQTRRKLIAAIDEYKGEDPLQPWVECIKWVQEAFPAGGDSSGLVVIYEQCVRTFWHDDRYKNDFRYLKVWLEYAENCADAQLIYSFLEANEIGQTHSSYYIAYALFMEAKQKNRTANEIFNRGLSLNAQPLEKLQAAYRKFLARSMRKPVAVTDEDDNCLPSRSFGTVLTGREQRRQALECSDMLSKKCAKGDQGQRIPLSVYKDNTNVESRLVREVSLSKVEPSAWDSLGTQSERNKENKACPAKWSSYKIPRRPAHRSEGSASSSIPVFVDDECSQEHKTGAKVQNSSLQLQEENDTDFKRETKLLREDPLRNFPSNSLPR